MSLARLYLFGPVQAERAGKPVELNLSKGKALLAYLILTARPHTRDALAAMFWPEADGSRGRASLRRVLYHLQQAFGDELLLTTGETIGRNPEAALWVDVEAFRQQVAACTDGKPALPSVCLERLEEALALYRDELLAGLTLADSPAFDEWQFFEREALRGELAGVLVRLSNVYEEMDNWESAVAVTRRWVALDTLHEPAHRQLMRLYALAGQQAAALRQYDE